MNRALIAGVGCWLAAAAPAGAASTAVQPPLLQSWSDTGEIVTDDDWSGVPGWVGHRGDGLVAEPGADPRAVTADGSGTPVDVAANRTDPRAVGLAAGVAEFELANPVVAIQGSATAGAPHLLLSLDTRGSAGVSVRLVLRDIDASTTADAVEPVSVQYRVGPSGDFAPAPGGYVADATTGPGQATLVTPVRTLLPAVANGQPLVQVRVITTNAVGQDEWVGIDDVEVTAASRGVPGGCPVRPPAPRPGPAPGPGPAPPSPATAPAAAEAPAHSGLELTDLELSPDTFTPALRGRAITRRARAGAALRFRLSRTALVRFEAVRGGSEPQDLAPKLDGAWFGPARRRPQHAARRRGPGPATGGRFAVRARRGLNRLRFSGRARGRPLAPGAYTLRAVAVDRAGRKSAPAAVRFRIRVPEH